MGRLCAALLGALALGAGAVAETRLAVAQPAADFAPSRTGPESATWASYWWRIDNPPADPLSPPRAWYRPVRTVPGAPGPFLPVADAAHLTLPQRALDDAAQFAEAHGSTAFIVVHRGVVQAERYFAGNDGSTIFSSHSFMKTLVAMAVGAAQADGHIGSLDDPASRWLPEWRDAARERITLRQLLSMSGGFNTSFNTDPAHRFMWMHYGSDVPTIVRTAKPTYTPGEGYAYDNDTLHALGLVLERATGEPVDRYLSRRLWQPLGAGDMEMLLDREGGRVMAYCCGWSTARDWVRVGQTLLDGGVWQGRRLLPQAFVDAMREPSSGNPSFGLQLMRGAAWLDPRINRSLPAQQGSLAPALASDLVYLTGARGFQLALVPSEQLMVLRVGRAAPGWREHVLPNLLVAAARNTPYDTGWIQAWRQSTRPRPGTPLTLAHAPAAFWPRERVAGAERPTALPRRTNRCLAPERLQPLLAETDTSRAWALLVWREGAVEFEHYAPGFDAELRAETGSMHASVLALLVGQLMAEGRMASLEAPVSTWMPEWAGDARGAITVGHLLHMTSGLAPLTFSASGDTPYTRLMFGPDSAGAALAAAAAAPPGQRFEHHATASQLLGLVVERAGGARYAQLLSSRLWQALGAAEAWVVLDRPGGLARTSATLLARPEDWLRLGALFADAGQINGRPVANPAWIQRMAAPGPVNPRYGLHLWRASPAAPPQEGNAAAASAAKATEPFATPDMVFFADAAGHRVYASAARRLAIVRIGPDAAGGDDSRLPNAVMAALDSCGASATPSKP